MDPLGGHAPVIMLLDLRQLIVIESLDGLSLQFSQTVSHITKIILSESD